MYKFLILILVIFTYSCANPNTENICEENPCFELNKGVCSTTDSSYVCSCDEGYRDKGGKCIKDIVKTPCSPNPCVDENRNICNSDNDQPICLCNTGFHDEESICVSSSKNVLCKPNETLPKDSHEVSSNVEIIYENNQWQEAENCEILCNLGFNKNDSGECVSETQDLCADLVCTENSSCDAGNCICDSGFHKNGELCEADKKMIECNDNSPLNSSKVDAQVEVVYNEGTGWTSPIDCAWNCNENFHKEGNSCVENALECQAGQHEENGACIDNTKMVACNDNTPLNATKISAQVEVTYTLGNGWSVASDCDWNCVANFHKEGDACSSNTRMVDCNDSSIPDNSTKTDAQVEINYVNNAWTNPVSCEWTCNNNFHEESNSCVSNTKMIACNDSTPANAVKVDSMVEVIYSNGAWANPNDCDWNCIADFHKEGDTCVADGVTCGNTQHEENGVCVDNTKMISCNDASPLNSTKVDAQVEVTYTQESGWSTPIDCLWNCDNGYYEENGACIENGTIACDDEFESNNTFDLASIITDGNTTGLQHRNLTICEGDEDWFKIDSSANSGLEIDVNYTHLDGECDIDLTLYKMLNGQLIQVDAASGFSGLETVYVRNTLIAETYYLKVYGYESNCENSYSLTANVFNNCIDDEDGLGVSEHDDTLEEANSFSLNTSYNRTICDYDDDWYTYYFKAGDTIKITLDLINANGDLDISLLDSNGMNLKSTYGFLDQEVISYEIPSDGNYFIKVRGWTGSSNDYSLKVINTVVDYNIGNVDFDLLDNACKVFTADLSEHIDSTTATITSLEINKMLVTHEFLSDLDIFLAVGDEIYTQIWTSSSSSYTLDNNNDDDAENDADIDFINRTYDTFIGNSIGDKKLKLKICDSTALDVGKLKNFHFTIKYTE